MSDTFIGDVHNLSAAVGDIVTVYAVETGTPTNYIALVENGTVNFDPLKIDIQVNIKNNGETDGSFTITLYRDNVQTETATISISAGFADKKTFNNAAAGYDNPDGETHTYKATVSP